MYRIMSKKLLVLVRLVIIVSLAGYSLSNATAAMHDAQEAQSSISALLQHSDGASAHKHHGQMSSGHDEAGTKLIKQECCQDFCIGMAIIVSCNSMRGPVLSARHDVIDDRGLKGEMPSLHRPPNI